MNHPSFKQSVLEESSNSRFNSEYVKLLTLGSGNSGTTSLCLNRLDGCSYAIKRCRHPLRGSVMSSEGLCEVRILAALNHQNVVRYHNSWLEDNIMYVVTEYCDGGSVQNMIVHYRDEDIVPYHLVVTDFIHQISRALSYLHQRGICHMDLKPENVLMRKNVMWSVKPKQLEDWTSNQFSPCSSSPTKMSSSPGSLLDGKVDNNLLKRFIDDSLIKGMSDLDLNYIRSVYKIGDFDHSFHEKINKDIVEGDSRFMPGESLIIRWPPAEDTKKIDIFSLGFCVIDMLRSENLPKNGTEWRNLRMGILPFLPVPAEVSEIISSMCQKDPDMRPCASEIARNSYINEQLKLKPEIKLALKKCRKLMEIEKDQHRTTGTGEIPKMDLQWSHASEDNDDSTPLFSNQNALEDLFVERKQT